MNLTTWIITLLAMVALDVAWALYNRATAQHKRWTAALVATALPVLGTMNAIAAVEDPRYLSATALGAFVGTWLGVALSHRLERGRGAARAPVSLDRVLALECAQTDVAAELQRARMKFAPFHSAHEGFAVALEEVDELRAHVWRKQSERDLDKMRTEAIQAAAMFTAFAAECCGEESGRV